ncbi:PRP3-domain-containing protein [Acaromyces ingoldii]|uniref:PRP3-domain-containing protein n=1 Tax=Acaromyces ingoldii TaxID=215250 RepID=A0A316YWZ3_9BASI|nr:PRP3-domain-containing protein [Acaromyces ingoldii]PWN93632.1 PRP3-domain-containing protein [Acaromyces ingoldii]
MPPKRPNEAEGANGLESAVKKPRTSAEGAGPQSIQAQIEAARARAQALLAKHQPNLRSGANGSGQEAGSSAASRPAQPVARPPQAPSNGVSSKPASGLDIAAMQKQLAEARQRTLERTSMLTNKGVLPASRERDGDARGSGIHPLLSGRGETSSAPSTSTSARGKPASTYTPRQNYGPKFSSLNANNRFGTPSAPGPLSSALEVPEKVNPYLSQTDGDEEAGLSSVAPKSRSMHKGMAFHRPGRHVRAAEEARREAQMEALKKRIQESARKAGMEELSAEERALRRNPPPEVEWWDMAFLPGKTYDAVAILDARNEKSKEGDDDGGPLLAGEGSPIDLYIQHPIPIPAPTDKNKVSAKGVMLTKKEMKKMRKQRRLAEQEDKRDRIKMGLLPPDPPKVKLSNLMRVLTSEAVADPTKVEAQVRREVAARKDKHERTNEENKLTPEERHAKLLAKQQSDEAKGLFSLVFKIRHLISPSHKFKARKNALQNGLTGLAVFHENFALIVVEGASKGIKAYKHLMTNRINWQDPGRPKEEDDDETASSAAKEGAGGQDELAKVEWSENRCDLIFEGPIRERNVAHGFRARNAPSDTDAKEILGPMMAPYWDLAKRFKDPSLEE